MVVAGEGPRGGAGVPQGDMEITGDAAVLVDPLDVGAIAKGIDEADRRRAELVPRGLERAKLYTWDRAAAAAVGGYERALG